jgi:hypothetical protein
MENKVTLKEIGREYEATTEKLFNLVGGKLGVIPSIIWAAITSGILLFIITHA